MYLRVMYVGCLSGQYDEDFEPPTYQDSNDHSPVDELALSFEDIGTLRKSLEHSLRDSLSHHADSAVRENSSDYDSCSEELDSTDDLSPSTSPLPQLKEHGIMLEFESQPRSTVSLISRPSTVRNTEQKSIAPHSHEMLGTTQQDQSEYQVSLEAASLTELHSNMLDSTTRHQTHTQDNAPLMNNLQNTRPVHLATRSLSATRKKQTLYLEEDHESTQAVVDAVSLENKTVSVKTDEQSATVTSVNVDPSSPSLVLGQISNLVHENSTSVLQASPTPHHTAIEDRQSSNIANDNTVRMYTEQQSYNDTEGNYKPSKGESSSNPISSPFKPVLVSRYKSHSSQAKSPQERNSGTHEATPLGENEEERELLTEHTLSVITAKVREMDAR